MKQNKGFTLIELSIVIIIIGLIVAGVVAGKSIVQQAKLRDIITQYNNYKLAVNTFKLEYGEIPGDISNASAYGLGSDGNGDRKIHNFNSEVLYVWAHLSNANLLANTYIEGQPAHPKFEIGSSSPSFRYGKNVTAIFTHIGLSSSNCIRALSQPLFGIYSYINVVAIGSNEGDSAGCPRVGFLKVKEARGMDIKLDDGLPDNGTMFSVNSQNTNVDGNRCVDKATTDTSPARVNYDLDETGNNCRLIFRYDIGG